MRRIITPAELDAVMLATPGCCLLRESEGRRVWHNPAWQAAIHDDLVHERVQYFTETGQDYIRAFRQDGQLFVDCIREQRRIAQGAYGLARHLGESVLVPWLMPGLEESETPLPPELKETFPFRLAQGDPPRRLVSFIRSGTSRTSFYRIQP